MRKSGANNAGGAHRRRWNGRHEAPAPCRLLIADDQPDVLEALRLLLKPEGYLLEMVRTPALVLESLTVGALGRSAD
jgi:PleD family two-component response regulator